MKIAFILPGIQNKGSIIVFAELIRQLQLYPDICINVFHFGADDGFTLKDVNKAKISLFSNIRWEDFDVIHTSGFKPNLYAALFLVKWKHKLITTLHSYLRDELRNTFGETMSSVILKIWYFSIDRHAAVTTLTDHANSYYKRYLNTKIYTLYNCRSFVAGNIDGDDADLSYVLSLKSKYYILGTNAHISKIKGLNQVIKALVHLPECAFVVVGDGPEVEPLRQLAISLNVESRCNFVGYKVNVQPYLFLYDVYVMPSISEGFGLALIEAVANRIPAICSRIPTFQELFTEEEVGFFDLNDTKSLVEEVIRFKQPEVTTVLKARAYQKYINNYTPNRVISNLLKIYKSLC